MDLSAPRQEGNNSEAKTLFGQESWSNSKTLAVDNAAIRATQFSRLPGTGWTVEFAPSRWPLTRRTLTIGVRGAAHRRAIRNVR
jgi:hypothetical protein